MLEQAIPVREAAARMDLSEQRVRAMAKAGRILAVKVGRDWLVDPAGIPAERALAGRPLGADSAWALLALLAGDRPDWVEPSTGSRMRRLLRQAPKRVARLIHHSQPRSRILRWRVLPSDLPKIAAQSGLVRSGLSADLPELDVVDIRSSLDVYATEKAVERLGSRYRPDRSPSEPNLLLRVPSRDWILHRGADHVPASVVAADLLPSEDPRVRRAAQRLLADLIDG